MWLTPEFHLNPVLYPLNAMIQHMPLGVESVFSLYGYYPVYLAPLVSLFKPSLTMVFIIFSCITAVSIWLIFISLSNVVQNRLLRFIGACAVIYFPYFGAHHYLNSGNPFEDPYFQYFPLRIIFPALTLFILSLTIKYPRRMRLLLTVAAFIATTGVFWNMDSGTSILLAFLAFSFIGNLIPFRIDMELVSHRVLLIVIGAISAYAVFVSAFYLQTHTLPSFFSYAITVKRFSDLGATAIPLPNGLAIWQFILLVYVICIIFGYQLLNSENEANRGSFYVATGFLGCALMFYYFVRSHDHLIFTISWTAFYALTLIADRLYIIFKDLRGGERLSQAWFVFITVILLAAPISFVLDGEYLMGNIKKRLDFSSQIRDQQKALQIIKFIKDNSGESKTALIMTVDYDGHLYYLSQVKPPLNISSSTDLFLKSESKRIMDYLSSDVTVPVFVISSIPISNYPQASSYIQNHFKPDMLGPYGISRLKKVVGDHRE